MGETLVVEQGCSTRPRSALVGLFLGVAILAASSLATHGAGSTKADEATRQLGRASELASLAHQVMATDPARASQLARDAERSAQSQGTDPAARSLVITTAKWLEGDAALRMNDRVAAKTLLSDAFEAVRRQEPGSALEADIRVSRARLESTNGEIQSALTDYLTAFDIYKKVGNRRQQAVTLQDLGLMYYGAGDYERALSYYAQSRDTFSGSPVLDLSVISNRASALSELGRFSESEAAYLSALSMARKLQSPALEAQILNNLAYDQIKNKRYAAAESSLKEGLRIARAANVTEVMPDLLSANAQLAFLRGDVGRASALMDQALAEPGIQSASERDPQIHLAAAQVYKAKGEDARALKEFEAYQRLENARLKATASASTALMAARFDYENQNARITALRAGQLQRDIALTRLRARQGQIVLGGLLVLVTGLIIFLVLYLRTLRRTNEATRKINLQLTQTNAELEKALQAKTQFLATTSHEIRTPLNGILGLTEVLLTDRQLPPNLRQRVSLIHGAGETMRVLVDDLLDMSKIDAEQITLQRDVVDLPTLIWEIHRFWQTHAESSGLKLTLDISRSPVMIVEDARRLRQILSNLLSNAVKFTPSGVIALTVDTLKTEEAERLVIRVADSGIGIPESFRETIFEKFTQLDAGITRKYSGTGLGLSIARSLARSMGGDISIEANVPKGAVFVVDLPLERALLGSDLKPSSAEVGARPGAGLEVLMVEASPIAQAGMRSILEKRVDSLAFAPSLHDAAVDVRQVTPHVVIASLRKAGGEADPDLEADLADLMAAVDERGAHLVLIAEADHPLASAFPNRPRISVLARPVNAAKLLGHLEGLHEVDNTVPALRPRKLQEQSANERVAERS